LNLFIDTLAIFLGVGVRSSAVCNSPTRRGSSG
jgi:hypothetical protein